MMTDLLWHNFIIWLWLYRNSLEWANVSLWRNFHPNDCMSMMRTSDPATSQFALIIFYQNSSLLVSFAHVYQPLSVDCLFALARGFFFNCDTTTCCLEPVYKYDEEDSLVSFNLHKFFFLVTTKIPFRFLFTTCENRVDSLFSNKSTLVLKSRNKFFSANWSRKS